MGELINILGAVADSQIPQSIARDAEFAAADAAHVATFDPHSIYLKRAEIIKLTGFTSTSQGGSTPIPHNLVGDKIIGISVIVRQSLNAGVSANYSQSPGYEYQWFYDSQNFWLITKTGNSYNILNKPFVVLLTHDP